MQSRVHLFEGYRMVPFLIFDPNFYVPAVCDSFTSAARWQAAVNILKPLEFAFVSVTKLFVLFRMLDFAAPAIHVITLRRLSLSQNIAVLCVVCGNVVALVGNAVSTARFLTIPPILEAGSRAYFINHSLPDFFSTALTKILDAYQSGSHMLVVQESSECVALLVIVINFTASGYLCTRRLNHILKVLPGAAGGAGFSARRLRLQIVATVAVVFVGFILRMIYTILFAGANFGQRDSKMEISEYNDDDQCKFGGLCLSKCSNM
jgi:hypothetical protein